MGDNFLSKSFLFEIVDTNTQVIEKSFTLILPPSSYTIKEKHRVKITKTFGNAFIDDYGADNLELTIKGISGTAHVFPTFQTSGTSIGGEITNVVSGMNLNAGASSGYTHKTAFYTFRDDIMRYRDRDNFDQKEMRVYDLADEQAYKCILLEFDVDRSSEKPFHYPFTIQLFVYSRLNVKGEFKSTPISISKDPTSVFNLLEEASESLSTLFTVFDNIQTIKNSLQSASNSLTIVKSRFNTWLAEANSIIESPLIVVKQMLDILIDTGGFIYDAYEQGKITLDTYVNAKENINNQIREGLALYGYAIEEGSQTSVTEDIPIYDGMNYTDPSNAVPTSRNLSSSFSGVNLYTVKGEDTLQTIALHELGDSNLWPFIANVNSNILSNNDLEVGSQIYIPISVESTATNKDVYILTEDTLRDPYGSDILLNEDGEIVLRESSDLGIVSGLSNVLQALNTRLNTTAGSLVKQSAYGLMAQPGLAGTEQAVSYLKMNFTATLLQDPRVTEVTHVQTGVLKDQIFLSADVSIIGYEKSLPVSVTL